jgi:hypothetical protein
MVFDMDNSKYSTIKLSNKMWRYVTEVTSLSKVLAAIIFITLPFLGFYLGRQYPNQTVTETNTSVSDSVPSLLYKKTLLGGEIPVGWSEYRAGDVVLVETWPDTDFRSSLIGFSSDWVSYGDWNVNQVDVYIMTEQAANSYFDNAKRMAQNDPGMIIEEKRFDDVPVTVVTWPLDEGYVTKGGTGGSSYTFKTDAYSDKPSYIIIEKQARGDQFFEDSFAHFIETLDFKKLQDSPYYSWIE